MWLLSTNGIIDENLSPVDTPFGNRLVHHGSQNGKKVALIVDRSEIWLFDGQWSQLLESDWTLNCLVWVGDQLLVGTEKARLAWVGDTLDFIEAFDIVPNRDRWDTPWGGPPDVRSLAVSEDWIYANIHVGWIVGSPDRGRTWNPLTNGLHRDVHQVSTIPGLRGYVLAATAGGFHLSTDNGSSFEKRWNSSPTYQRAVAGFDAENILVSVSGGPGGHRSRLMRTSDAGKSWNTVAGLPETIEDNINTYQLQVEHSGKATVILENTSIYSTRDYGESWHLDLKGLPKTYQVIIL